MDKMTNEEAIAIIRKEYLCVDRDCDIERNCGKCDLAMPSKEPILQAYKLAIKALERAVICGAQEPCEDCISRKAAIDAIWDGVNMDIYTREVKECLEALPPVTPAKKQEPCTDAISRQAVLMEIDKYLCGVPFEKGIDKVIKELPSVTPAEKVGRWEYVQYDGNPNIGNWHCSECRAIVDYKPIYNWEKKPYHKFCSNCGAKMQEAKE